MLTCTNISVIIISTGKQRTEDMNMKNEKQYRLVTESDFNGVFEDDETGKQERIVIEEF